VVYGAKYHPNINACLSKYSHLKKRFKKKKDYILKSPIDLGEPLKGNLNGLRSFPFAGNFIIIYIICQECRTLQHQQVNRCIRCSETPDNTVIFLAFGPHDPTYKMTPSVREKLEVSDFSVFT